MTTTFGSVLRHCRRLAGLSQLELALDADVSPRHLSFLESGRAEPGRAMVARLSTALRLAGTARNALFISAGFAPMSDIDDSASDTFQVMERMILGWDPQPGALADSDGYICATNMGMRALHAFLSGSVCDLRGLSAMELALGARGLGPYLTNRAALERRFAHCRALEKLVAAARSTGCRRRQTPLRYAGCRSPAYWAILHSISSRSRKAVCFRAVDARSALIYWHLLTAGQRRRCQPWSRAMRIERRRLF